MGMEQESVDTPPGVGDHDDLAPTKTVDTVSAVIKEMCATLHIGKADLAVLARLSDSTMERLWRGDYDPLPVDKRTGRPKRRKIRPELSKLEGLCRQRRCPPALIDRLWIAAGWPPTRQPLSPGRSADQSVGLLLQRYRGQRSQGEMAHLAYPDVAARNPGEAVALVQRIEEMQDGDYSAPGDVRALLLALDKVRPLEARELRDVATTYLWIRDLADARTRRSVIAVLISSTVLSPFWAEMVKGCIAFAARHTEQYWIAPSHHEENIHTEIRLLDGIGYLDVAGAILAPAPSYRGQQREEQRVRDRIARLRRRGVPVVVVDRQISGEDSGPWVGPVNREIGRLAVEAILARKHRRLGLLLDLKADPHTLREEGALAAVEAFRKRTGEEMETVVEWGTDLPVVGSGMDGDYRGLVEAAIRLLERMPSAVFCGTSEGTQALLAAMTRMEEERKMIRGTLRRAVSIVSGDDVPSLAADGIDCVAYRGEDLARHSMEVLMRLIADPNDAAALAGRRVQVSSVIPRGSLKRLRPSTANRSI